MDTTGVKTAAEEQLKELDKVLCLRNWFLKGIVLALGSLSYERVLFEGIVLEIASLS